MPTVLRLTGLKVYGAIGLIFLSTLVYAEEPTPKPSERSAEHTLNYGNKWGTDEALRRSMNNIRQVMNTSQGGIKKESLSAQEYQRLAEAVDKNIADIIKNRKLTKAFHVVVLADLTQSTELMRTSTKIQEQRVGALGVLQSLHNYGEYFQHPGWRLDYATSL
ncbi:MAG: hypothetical protein K2P67_10300 [Gallionellaceae bacterium]|nr:hypothetical protein [Gallionellaceae bacterium]